MFHPWQVEQSFPDRLTRICVRFAHYSINFISSSFFPTLRLIGIFIKPSNVTVFTCLIIFQYLRAYVQSYLIPILNSVTNNSVTNRFFPVVNFHFEPFYLCLPLYNPLYLLRISLVYKYTTKFLICSSFI